ncbi:MAG TPA: hypothetical protein VF576_03455 [Rubricoccaceae bacterium]|jgi:hypothetical protein
MARRPRVLDVTARLRPLTWAGAEAVCAGLSLPGGPAPDGGEATRPLALDDALTGQTEGWAIVPGAGRAVLAAACVDDDLAGPLGRVPASGADEVAGLVVAGFLEAVRAAQDEARVYGDRRTKAMPEPYRTTCADARNEARGSAAWTAPTAFATEGTATWAVLHEWPLARVLCYFEDRAVGGVLREIERTVDEMKAEAGVDRRG